MKKYYFLENCQVMNLKSIKDAIIYVGHYNNITMHDSCKIYGGINNYVYDQNKNIIEVKQFKLLRYIHYIHNIIQLIFIISLYIIPLIVLLKFNSINDHTINMKVGISIIVLLVSYGFYITSIYLIERCFTKYRYKILSKHGSR